MESRTQLARQGNQADIIRYQWLFVILGLYEMWDKVFMILGYT